MDRFQQRQPGTDPCGPGVQSGPCAFKGTGPEMLNTGTPAPVKAAEHAQPSKAKTGSAPAGQTSISRPRPTATGTKPQRLTRVSVDPSKDIDLIPLCIPGPQSAHILPHSPTESSLNPHSPQGPLSPQPFLSPTSTLPLHQATTSRPSSPNPQPQRSPPPGKAAHSPVPRSEKTNSDNKDFR